MTLAGNTTIPAGAWTYAVMTYDGSNMKLYVNGALDGSVAQTGTFATNLVPLNIGRNNNSTEYFPGSIDEVRISKTARSADWIFAEYNNQKSPSTFYAVGNEIAGSASVALPVPSN